MCAKFWTLPNLIANNISVYPFWEFMQEKRELFSVAIDEILSSRSWQYFDEEALSSFVRLLDVFDQSKANELAAQLTQSYCDNDIATLRGLLKFRQANQTILAAYSGRPCLDIRKRLNVAICISGQLRGYEQCFSNFMKAFDFEKHNISIFVHTWKNIGRKFPIPNHARRTFSGKFLSAYLMVFQHKDVKSFLQTNYSNFYTLFSSRSRVSADTLTKFYNTDNVIVEDDFCAPFNRFSNPEKMYYKIYQSVQMTMLHDFDLVIRVRPDFAVKKYSGAGLLDLYHISRDKRAVLVNNRLTVWGLHSIDDNLAIATPQIMNIYARTYYDMKKVFWKKHAWCCPPVYTGHFTLEYQLFAHGVRVEILGLPFSFRDPERIPIMTIYDALKKDVATRTPTEDDNILLQACEEDIALLASQQG